MHPLAILRGKCCCYKSANFHRSLIWQRKCCHWIVTTPKKCNQKILLPLKFKHQFPPPSLHQGKNVWFASNNELSRITADCKLETHLLGFELHSDIAAVGQDIKHWTITVNWMRYRWHRTIPFMCRPQLAKGNEKLKSSTSKGNFLPLKQLLSKFFLEWMKSVQDAFAICAHCCQPPAWDRAKRSKTIISNYYVYVDS